MPGRNWDSLCHGRCCNAQVLGGSPNQIEYAAEMGMEHNLGLTCDPVLGYVQIPCIERNAIAASKAYSCGVYALSSDGGHKISFDRAVETMAETGRDIQVAYRKQGLADWQKVGSHSARIVRLLFGFFSFQKVKGHRNCFLCPDISD